MFEEAEIEKKSQKMCLEVSFMGAQGSGLYSYHPKRLEITNEAT